MKSLINKKNLLIVALGLTASIVFAQQSTTNPKAAAAAAADVWKYQAKRLTSTEIDSLLATPEKLLVIDVRRPDELSAKGSFPVYLNIQAKDLEKSLAYIPKDRAIITVSNHAHRAGAAADILAAKGYKVAGAAGSEDYEAQGGKSIIRIAAPIAKAAPIAAAN